MCSVRLSVSLIGITTLIVLSRLGSTISRKYFKANQSVQNLIAVRPGKPAPNQSLFDRMPAFNSQHSTNIGKQSQYQFEVTLHCQSQEGHKTRASSLANTHGYMREINRRYIAVKQERCCRDMQGHGLVHTQQEDSHKANVVYAATQRL